MLAFSVAEALHKSVGELCGESEMTEDELLMWPIYSRIRREKQ